MCIRYCLILDKLVFAMEKIHYDIVVRGRVQGVWFRKYTKDKADELGIKGFVQNELEDIVYVEAEGTEDMLNQFIERLHVGSPLSRVNKVHFDTCIDFQGYTKFEIKK